MPQNCIGCTRPVRPLQLPSDAHVRDRITRDNITAGVVKLFFFSLRSRLGSKPETIPRGSYIRARTKLTLHFRKPEADYRTIIYSNNNNIETTRAGPRKKAKVFYAADFIVRTYYYNMCALYRSVRYIIIIVTVRRRRLVTMIL